MGYAPVSIGRIAVESTAELIVYPSDRHAIESVQHHVQRILALFPLPVTHQIFQGNWTRKFRRIAKAAVGCIVVAAHLAIGHPKSRRLNPSEASAARGTQLSGE